MASLGQIIAAPFTGGASLLDDPGGFIAGEPSQSRPVEVPGLFDREAGQEFAGQAIDLTRTPLRFSDILGQQVGGFGQPSQLRSDITGRLLSPDALPSAPGRTGGVQGLSPSQLTVSGPEGFGGQLSPSEAALIDQLLERRQGTFNALGIGSSPGAQAAIAASAAPALVQLRQRDFENRLAAQQQSIQNLLQQQGLDISQRGQDIGQRAQDIGVRGQDIRAGQQQIQDLLGGERLFTQSDLAEIDRILKAQGIDLGGRQLDINTLLSAAGLGQTRVGQQATGQEPGLLDFVNIGVGPEGVSAGIGR